MSRLGISLQREKGNKALIPFITAGHPKPEWTVPLMHTLVSHGANVIELGVPFSDPMADGEVIQLSSELAIKNGVGLKDVLIMVKEFRQHDDQTPVVLMGYLNPVECFGYEAFVKQAQLSGVDGVLLVDSPIEESKPLLSLLRDADMSQIFLIAPTTTETRMRAIIKEAREFIYYVALKGVTGAANLESGSVNSDVKRIKNATDLPVGVGFGIKDPSSAVAVAQEADAVVIGSALVKIIGSCSDLDEAKQAISEFIKPIRNALDSL